MIDRFFINPFFLLCVDHHDSCCSRTCFKPFWDYMICVCMNMIKALGLTSFTQTVPIWKIILSETPLSLYPFLSYITNLKFFEPTYLFLSWFTGRAYWFNSWVGEYLVWGFLLVKGYILVGYNMVWEL